MLVMELEAFSLGGNSFHLCLSAAGNQAAQINAPSGQFW